MSYDVFSYQILVAAGMSFEWFWKLGNVKSFMFVCIWIPQRMSTAAQSQSEVDFLKGELHRKHPGVTNLKTLSLPEELQTAAKSIIKSRFRYYFSLQVNLPNISVASLLNETSPKCCVTPGSLHLLQGRRWLGWPSAHTASPTSCGAENEPWRTWHWDAQRWAWRGNSGRKQWRREEVSHTHTSINKGGCRGIVTVKI